MVCDVCGTRNLSDEARCQRCGARLPVPPPAPAPEPEPERELTPGERLAVEARELLASGDPAAALRAAQHAAVMEPDTFLCRLALGEVYLATDADADALREFRRAAEIDPESAEARDNAELARRRLTHPREAAPPTLREWRAWLVARKPLVSVAAGVLAALLVFTVGASAIVSRTSPGGQANRLYREQMQLGREHYRAGRYEQAATAFEQAWRLKPGSTEAKRRLDDALAVAGLAPSPASTPSRPAGPEVASIGPANNFPPMPPRWVGPTPPLTPNGRPAHAATAPPPIPDTGLPPVPPNTTPDLPPPMPDNTGPGPQPVGTGQDTARTNPPGPGGIGTAPAGDTAAPEATPPAEQRDSSRIVIQRVGPRRPVTPEAATPPKAPDPDALRSEANRLRAGGNAAAAARKYAEAAARYREEAAEGGAGAATRRSAAESCEAAQRLCESQGN